MGFFNDVINEKNSADKSSKPGAKTNFTDSNCLFRLDDDCTVNPEHKNNDGNYHKEVTPVEFDVTVSKKAPTANKINANFPLSINASSNGDSSSWDFNSSGVSRTLSQASDNSTDKMSE